MFGETSLKIYQLKKLYALTGVEPLRVAKLVIVQLLILFLNLRCVCTEITITFSAQHSAWKLSNRIKNLIVIAKQFSVPISIKLYIILLSLIHNLIIKSEERYFRYAIKLWPF